MAKPLARIAGDLLDEHGTTYAQQASIDLADRPAPLFQLLVLANLLAARIGADIAVAAARELWDAGLTTPAHMRASTHCQRVAAPATAATARALPPAWAACPSSCSRTTAVTCAGCAQRGTRSPRP